MGVADSKLFMSLQRTELEVAGRVVLCWCSPSLEALNPCIFNQRHRNPAASGKSAFMSARDTPSEFIHHLDKAPETRKTHPEEQS